MTAIYDDAFAPATSDAGDATVFPLSSAQHRLWLTEQMYPATSAYCIPLGVRLRGTLDVGALSSALDAVVARHEALRTTVGEVDGEAMQIVHPAAQVVLRQAKVERDRLGDVLAEAAAQPFDLSGDPLLRALLLRVDSDRSEPEHVLLLSVHHLVADLWSLGIVVDEVARTYSQLCSGRPANLPEPDLQYPDFSLWERNRLSGNRLDRHLDYWRDRMAGANPVLPLPTDRPRPRRASLRGRQLPVQLSAPTSSAVASLAARSGTTPFMVVLAALAHVVGRTCGQDDVTLTTGVATRTPQTEGVVGCFINIVPQRVDLAGDPTFVELLGRVRKCVLGALDHRDLPYDALIQTLRVRRDLGSPPFGQVMAIVQNAPLPIPAFEGLETEIVPVERGGSQTDLNLQLRSDGGVLTGFLEYATDLYDEASVSRLWSHIETLLTDAVERPEIPLSGLHWVTPTEISQAVTVWNETAWAPPVRRGAGLHDLVAAAVERHPDAIAVTGPAGSITFAELDRRADVIAAELSTAGVGPGSLVGVCLERSATLVLTLLAVLRTGAAYVPLDPDYPAERLEFLISDAAPAVVVASAATRGRLPLDVGTILVTTTTPDGELPRFDAPDVEAGDLAYVIYTSGSTGAPKGVAVTHGGIVNNVLDLATRFRVGRGDSGLAVSSASFDMSVWEMLGMLAAGGTVVLPDPERSRDPQHWVELIESRGVTVWNSAPSLLELLLDAADGMSTGSLASLRLALLGGDWIPVSLPGRWHEAAPAGEFISLGGATEASIHSIVQPVDEVPPDWQRIPYGRPMAGQQAYILDDGLDVVPVGVVGELYLGGTGLARGYLERPGLTAQRFVPHPFAGTPGVAPGARLYRTGDLTRYGCDGTIHLLGRIDHQIKVRGFRIEPAEIDGVLRTRPEVAEAVTVARTDEAGIGVGLTSYIVVSAEHPVPELAELRALLRERLPEHMVPDAIVPLEALPLSPNGKVDRSALPAPDARLRPAAPVVAPVSALERALCDVWSAVLQVEAAGTQEDFFELGGTSLGMTQVTSAVRDHLRVNVALRDVYDCPTVASQSALIVRTAHEQGVDVEAIADLYLQVRHMSDFADPDEETGV